MINERVDQAVDGAVDGVVRDAFAQRRNVYVDWAVYRAGDLAVFRVLISALKMDSPHPGLAPYLGGVG